METSIPPKSRITVRNGYVVLKMDNLHNSTRARINAYNNNPKNWSEGQIGALGPLAKVKDNTPEILPLSRICNLQCSPSGMNNPYNKN